MALASTPHPAESHGLGLDRALQVFSAYWIPALVALFTLAAMGLWPSLYPASSGRLLAFQALEDATGRWDVAQAQQALRQPAVFDPARCERRFCLAASDYVAEHMLPLLVAAGWLFAKKRHGTYWPFVWGFIFFAVFAFFVELVPYLPSYGGYVRYVVGIAVTAVVGRYAILALNRYLERQKLAETLPDQERRKELSYDVALARLAKSVCPGCERPVDLKNEKIDFCPHCGIGLFDHCGHCSTRKSAFARFCHACGTGAGVKLASED